MIVEVDEILLPRNNTGFSLNMDINAVKRHYKELMYDKCSEKDRAKHQKYLDEFVPFILNSYNDFINIDNAWRALGHGHIDYYDSISQFMQDKEYQSLFSKYKKN